MALTTHSHPAPRLKKEKSYISTPPLGLRGLFWGELYLTFTLLNKYDQGDEIKYNVMMGNAGQMVGKTKVCKTVVSKPSSINYL